jgi:predicted metal-dependent hydrolase
MNFNFDFEIKRSKRKTLSVEIKSDCTILVRAPYFVKDKEIEKFINEKSGWINKTLQKMKLKQSEKIEKLSPDELYNLKIKAMDYIPNRVEYFAKIMNVEYGRVTIRAQKTRWGSCSSKKNLNFNCLLMLAPKEVADSVIVHELCHLKEMNHSKKFYDEILKVYPNYHKYNKWLKENGSSLIKKIP